MRRACPDLEYMRGVEVQDGKRSAGSPGRGALHDHIVCRTKYPIDERLVRRLAMQAGFGHSVDVVECAPGSKREAYYVAKYITKSADARRDVPWRADVVNVETGEVVRGLVPGRYRTWSCSRRWGLTMAQVRAEAAVVARSLALKRDELIEAQAFESLAAVFDFQRLDESPPAPS